jgi:hypothetical protein
MIIPTITGWGLAAASASSSSSRHQRCHRSIIVLVETGVTTTTMIATTTTTPPYLLVDVCDLVLGGVVHGVERHHQVRVPLVARAQLVAQARHLQSRQRKSTAGKSPIARGIETRLLISLSSWPGALGTEGKNIHTCCGMPSMAIKSSSPPCVAVIMVVSCPLCGINGGDGV